ncbi:hypothetical protein L6452_35687 [Arctium lappa]|uniref:Uncharacterized protein n=1 Tax=Arctium lappa TaxID=4217 RepID=A0ACB8Y8A5_ARCLA|nr:hypothetical protein L6452_35687 [Arctium lappa]
MVWTSPINFVLVVVVVGISMKVCISSSHSAISFRSLFSPHCPSSRILDTINLYSPCSPISYLLSPINLVGNHFKLITINDGRHHRSAHCLHRVRFTLGSRFSN